MPKNKITSTEKIGIPVFIYRHWGNLSVWQRKLLFVVGLFLLFSVSVQAQITGTVFRDFNGNGTKESAEPLVAGVEVKAYDTAGSQCGTTQTTTAASAPNYSLSGCTGAVRVEFTIPTGTCFADDGIDYAALGGGAHGTSVQFLANTSAGTRTANFALFYPGEYGGADSVTPDIYSVVMVGGNPLLAGTAQAAPTIVKTPYSASGTVMWPAAAAGDLPASKSQRQVGHTTVAQASQTGTLWGMTYSKQANKLFASAFLRRHAGLGPLGPGGVYMADPNTISLSANLNFFDFDTDLGIATHSSAGVYNTDPMKVGTNAQRLLPANPAGVPTADAPAYDQVGKVSLGDLDISDDGRYLFITNLYDRKLYRIDLQDPTSPVKPTAAQVIGYTIPNPCTGANAGESRPFGLKVFRGKLYAGTVCSGQTSANAEVGTSTTMGAYVYEFNLTTLSFNTTPIYSQNFSYRDAIKLQNNPPYTVNGNWQAWKNEFEYVHYNQPWLTDIEFDAEGNMILGLTDRNSYQTGSANYNTAGTGSFSKTYANGDNLHLTKTGTSTCAYTTTNNDYYRDCAQFAISAGDDPNCVSHNETSFGPMAVHRFGNKDELVAMALNPVTHISNGFNFYNNDNGAWVKGNELWYDPAFGSTANTLWGKAGGVGDMEVFSPPAPIEIGNRVWLDTDNDGIQDAGEAGISGVTVELVKSGTVISTATTDANGNYYFSSATGTDTASIKYGLTQLMPNMAYTVRFPTTTTVAATTYNLTTAAAGSNRLIDSNAPANGEVTVLATDIPVAGANNHTFDVGYSSAPVCSINTPTIAPTCNDNGTSSNPADDTFTFTISATGTGVGANYKVDKIAPAPTSTVFASVNYGATSAASSSFPISGGNLTLTLTDNTTATCTLSPVTVTAPPTCSNAAPGQPDLKLLKTASSASVAPGQTLTYTLTLTNEGTASATGVVVRDVLPTAVSYVTSVASQGSYDNGTGLWMVGTVAVGASLTLTITVTVN